MASDVCADLYADEHDRIEVVLRLAQLIRDAGARWAAADEQLRCDSESQIHDGCSPGAASVHDAAAQLRWLSRRRALLAKFGVALLPSAPGQLRLGVCDPTLDAEETFSAA